MGRRPLSVGLTAAARTLMRTSPGPGSRGSRSMRVTTSGPPVRSMPTARMPRVLPDGVRSTLLDADPEGVVVAAQDGHGDLVVLVGRCPALEGLEQGAAVVAAVV